MSEQMRDTDKQRRIDNSQESLDNNPAIKDVWEKVERERVVNCASKPRYEADQDAYK